MSEEEYFPFNEYTLPYSGVTFSQCVNEYTDDEEFEPVYIYSYCSDDGVCFEIIAVKILEMYHNRKCVEILFRVQGVSYEGIRHIWFGEKPETYYTNEVTNSVPTKFDNFYEHQGYFSPLDLKQMAMLLTKCDEIADRYTTNEL